MRSRLRTLPAFLGVLFTTAGCDHATKQVALAALSGAESVSLVGDALRFELASNPGAFLGLGTGLPEGIREAVLLWLVPLVVLSLCAYLLFHHGSSARMLVGLGLVAGGGMANWFDRILHGGAVTDFIVLGVGPLQTGVFNIADVAVVAGVVMLVRVGRQPAQRHA